MCALNQGEEKLFLEEAASLSRTKKSSQLNFPLIFSTTTQTNFRIQQRFLVLEILEIVSCGNLTGAIAVLIALR